MTDTNEQNLTLRDFIEKNQGLLSSIAVLFAIATFVDTLSVKWLGSVLMFLSIAGVVTLWTELFMCFPKTGSIRLILFKNIISLGLMGFVLYWFLAFDRFWNIFFFVPLFLLLFYMSNILLKQFMSVSFIKRLFGEKGKRNIWQKILVVIYAVIVFYGLMWMLSISIGASPGFNYILELIRLNFK